MMQIFYDLTHQFVAFFFKGPHMIFDQMIK